MHVQDLSEDRRIARLTELTRELHDSQTPEDTLRILHSGFADMDGAVAVLLLSTREVESGHYRIVHIELPDDKHDHRLSQPPADTTDAHCGGVLGKITARRAPQLVQSVNWGNDPFFHEMLEGYSSLMAVPIIGDRLPMNWVVLLRSSPRRFAFADLEAAVERVALVGALLEKQTLVRELARAHEQIDRDARQVGELQRALLPATLPRIAGMEIAASYEPLGRAGGDLYDFFPLDECRKGHAEAGSLPSRWCVFIGDIEGHGLAAAVVMAIVHAVLNAYPSAEVGPSSLLMHLNQQLCGKKLGGLVTAFLGIYDPASRQLVYSRAGHPPPLLKVAADGSIRALDAVGSYPLGIDAADAFAEAVVQLGCGDNLLLYTDGVTEAQGEAARQFGIEQLTHLFRVGGDRPAALVDRLREALRMHVGTEMADDDRTIVAARIH